MSKHLMLLTDPYPQYWWRDNAAPLNEKNWCLAAQGGDFFLQAIDDANSLSNNVLRVQRTGITIDSLDWVAGAMRLNGVSLRDASIIDSGVFPPGRLGTGTPSSSNFLRGDGTWIAPPAGVTDHGALTGLSDNDHPQYSLTSHTHAHSALSGLGNDDHTQYYNTARGDARYVTKTSAQRPGVTKLYRSDDDSGYYARMDYSANYSGLWSLRGFTDSGLHAGCYVERAGVASQADSISAAFTVPRTACALVYFNAGTGVPNVLAQYNVSSLGDNGTGDVTINFSTALVQQSMMAGWGHNTSGSQIHGVCGGGTASIGSTSARTQTRGTGGANDFDTATIMWIKP